MTDDVIRWLLEKDSPAVRYSTLVKLLGRPLSGPEVIATGRTIMETGVVPDLLARQNLDGSWGVPEKFYTAKYTGTVWSLLILAEMGASGEDPRVERACEFMLGNVQEPETGGFSMSRSARSGSGLPSGVVPCLTGNMVYSLIRLGHIRDERVQKAIDWIVTCQRTDDGDGEPPTGGIYDRSEICFGRHSCHMGVAKSLKALSAIPPEMRDVRVTAKLDELTEYFLAHHIYKKSHNLSEVARPGWLRPGFPLMYQTDILEILEILTDLGVSDPRMEDATEIIRNKKMPDGKWKMENSFNGKMNVDVETKGQPSKWITLKALKILQ